MPHLWQNNSIPVRFLLTGHWLPGQIHSRSAASSFHPTQDIQSLIESTWQSAQSPTRHLFDGPMCRLESFHTDGPNLHLHLSPISYKSFYATNMTYPELADQFGDAILANPLGVSCGLISYDNLFLLGRRNERVAYYPGRIHPFAGALEPQDSHDLFQAVHRELHEELRLAPNEVTNLHCLALAQDISLRQPELIFLAQTPLPLSALQDRLTPEEHHSVHNFPFTKESIHHELATQPLLTPLAAATLSLAGQQLSGVNLP